MLKPLGEWVTGNKHRAWFYEEENKKKKKNRNWLNSATILKVRALASVAQWIES